MKRRKSERAALYETPTYLSLLGRMGANVRRLRHARGWTQEECAHRCRDLGPALLRTIESGRSNLTAATLARLCDGLEVDAAEFFMPTAPLAKRRPGRPRAAKPDATAISKPPSSPASVADPAAGAASTGEEVGEPE